MNIDKILRYVPLAALVVSTLAFGVALILAWYSFNTFEWNRVSQNPPKLEVAQIHIWVKGKGAPLEPKTKAPLIEPGQKIEGTAFIRNVGGTSASVQGSDLTAVWLTRINMYNPGWSNPGHQQLQDFVFDPNQAYALTGPTKELKPGNNARWAFAAPDVPVHPEGQSLYIVGNVVFKDQHDFQHGYYFVRRYDPATQTFVCDQNAGDSDTAF